jgi:hypothetical protein
MEKWNNQNTSHTHPCAVIWGSGSGLNNGERERQRVHLLEGNPYGITKTNPVVRFFLTLFGHIMRTKPGRE